MHAGGRGKAGGVKLVESPEEASAFAEQWLGKNLVTFQTDEKGQPVAKILVENCTDIADELYLGAVVDRGTQRVVFMASTEGGVEIEKVAEETPEKILKAEIDPLVGAQPYQPASWPSSWDCPVIRSSSSPRSSWDCPSCSMTRTWRCWRSTAGDHRGRQPALPRCQGQPGWQRPLSPSGPAGHARSLSGGRARSRRRQVGPELRGPGSNIGCMVNGAGLAMGTMDIIKLHGGQPANFLDVGGGATKERVAEASRSSSPTPPLRPCWSTSSAVSCVAT